MDIHAECPLHWLVTSDYFYREFRARLDGSDEKNEMGYTLLHAACQSPFDNYGIVRLLLARGADVDSTTPHGHTPLHFAVSSRRLDRVLALIQAGASVNSKDLFGRTVLHFAISKGESYPLCLIRNNVCNIQIVERLLCHPEIILNPVDEAGETPMMLAVKEQNLNAIMELLRKGTNPNIACRDNRTALHEALSAEAPVEEIVTALLLNGAGIYCVDNSGQTPIDIVVRNIRNGYTLAFAECVLKFVVLLYQMRESMQRKLERIPHLSDHLQACCNEVRLMNKLIIHGKFTLHDFYHKCIDVRVEDPVRDIHRPVVEILLSGLFSKYFLPILKRLTVQDLHSVLEITAPRWFQMFGMVSNHHDIYNAIKYFYDVNIELKRRLLRFKDLQ